jgi:hypothetical protein
VSGARSDERLRQGFVKGMVGVLAVFIAVAGIVHLANDGRHRPEGVAEDWLASVGDTTRKGVRAESARRAEEVGPVSLAASLLAAAGDTDGKRAFTDLEVGKARSVGGVSRVPYHLHLFDQDEARDGVVVLVRARRGSGAGAGWRVTGLAGREAGEQVPSEGGPPPSSAPGVLWVGALVAGVAITALASLAVRSASPARVAT